jgi:hypothetical protein
MEKLVVSSEAQAGIDAYIEYRNIVGSSICICSILTFLIFFSASISFPGDDDGGKLFTPAEYETYKRRVAPMRIKNRLYVSWGPHTGEIDCKVRLMIPMYS